VHPVVYVDVSAIRPGKLAELRAALPRLTRFVEENMPRVASYGIHLDDAGTTMSVVSVHPDSESLAFHLDRGADEFARFADLLDLARIDVYGEVSDPVLERLNRKARLLGDGAVGVHPLQAGFAR